MSGTRELDLLTRQPLPDLIRTFALIGIVLINVAAFAWPLEQGYSAAPMTPVDQTAVFLITTFFMTKAYALFSLMFGAGLAFQIASAQKRGKSPISRHFRRMLGLFVLGLMHMAFLFLGDILTLYALTGCLFYAFRNAKPKTLIGTGLSLLAVQIVIYFLFTGLLFLAESAPPASDQANTFDAIQLNIDTAIAVFGSGSFTDAVHYRLSRSPALIFGNTLAQGSGILGYFLLGLALAKTGTINAPEARFWHRCRWQAFPVGLIGSFLAAGLYIATPNLMSSKGYLGVSMLTLFAPLLAFGYAGWIARYAAGPATKLKRFLARAGTATLTAYLLQSVILSYIFSAYGLGLYAKLGPAQAIAIGLATGGCTLIITSLWQKSFARGPTEVLLRRWTYLGNH